MKNTSAFSRSCAQLALLVFLALAYFPLLAQNDNEQKIAPELVGKWCFMNITGSTADVLTNSCITLNADGSFEASLDRSALPNANSMPELQSSDYGTWWASGNRLYYNSSTNGKGAYSFQKVNHPRLPNTPMILINGIAFVTASSHDAW